MLARFNVGNFLSFKEVQEFSLIKGKSKDKNERIFITKQMQLLKFAAFFGANASGKSNLVSSMMFAQETILNSIPSHGNFLFFRLDEIYTTKPSYFEFEIIIDGLNYSYGFEIMLSKRQFVCEWLMELSPVGDDKIIFSRDIEKQTFTTDLKIDSPLLKNKFDVYSDDIKSSKNNLFLREMNRAKDDIYKEDNELSIFKKVFKWFSEVFDVNYPDKPVSDYSYFKDVEHKEEICRIIKSLGTGITNYVEQKSSLDQLKQKLPKNVFHTLEVDLNELKIGTSISMRLDDVLCLITKNKDSITVTDIVFNHGSEEIFNFSEESDGTKRILDLLGILFLRENKVYVIDEIDRSLHPQLTYKFIKEFLVAAKKRDIQLIITTHESRLLDFTLLRQDEIWIVDKNIIGKTALYSLDEYNLKFDNNIDKAYLEGRYGGVPVFGSIFPADEEE